MRDLTNQEWLDVLMFDFWLPPKITITEFEMQMERITEIMGEM